MALDKQINLFRVDTNTFLNENEKIERENLLSLQRELREEENEDRIKELEEKIKKQKKEYKNFILKSSKDAVEYNNKNENKNIRKLNDEYLYYEDKEGKVKPNLSNVVSMFESTLSRSFGIKQNELTTDIFILEIYYYDIAQDLIINGFDYNDKHYVYFSSSAGQIRTKKAVFVEEEKYEKCKPKLMCGLTVKKINELGGMNINKFLAYLALSNSATELWEDVFDRRFDIDRTVVIDDFETMVSCKVDNIDYKTYEIEKDVVMDMPIPHTDGCGIILSSYCKKNFMVRLPFIKGLLGSFDYIKFINENQCSSKIKDIWGKEYDVIEDDIQIIFTKSQLKMWKYYSSWDEYKEYFKEFECEAGVCNMEEDRIRNAKINYQMLQSLHDITDEEIKNICKKPNDKILNVSNSLKNMLSFFGVEKDRMDERKSYFQKALYLYPELLNDRANKDSLRDVKNSLIKKYKSGKLDVYGKFTFVLPDLYAVCEWLFKGEENPKGLLLDGEVSSRLYKNYDKLDCLRSPSLYIEHAIRKNAYNKKYRNQNVKEWLDTDAIYISTHDLISRILQLDCDGDKLLILAQKDLIKIAERNMVGVNPLYYEMKKAKAELITPHNIYNGLRLAFTGGNIGIISNNISKIWSQDNIGEKETNAIKWLCMETNFTIDYAKTLFKPTRPEHVDEILKRYNNMKLPYFFRYAKNKLPNQTKKIGKGTIDRIVDEIKTNKMMFNSTRNLEDINYLLFLKDTKDEYENEDVNKVFINWNRKYGNVLNIDNNKNKTNIVSIVNDLLNDLHEFEEDDDKIINSLVNLLYKKPSSRKKNLLWYTYGEKLYENLSNNLDYYTEVCMQCGKRVKSGMLVRDKCESCRKDEISQKGTKTIICVDCGREFEVRSNVNRRKRCDECKVKRDRENAVKRKKKQRSLENVTQ